MKMRNLIITMTAFSFLLSCGQRQFSGPTEISEPTLGYLSGEWGVHHIRYDNVVIDTTYLTIFHVDTHVSFIEEADTISTGTIVADTIRCTDMYGAGISRIFIDDEDHMHSEIPMVEYLNGLDFIRQGESGLSANLKDLSIQYATFSPPFSPEVTKYDVSFSSYPRSFQLTAIAEDGAASILVNDVEVQSGQQIIVHTSPPNFIVNIVVTSVDIQNRKTYVLNILDK